MVVGYVRVSTAQQDNGPEAQRAALRRWCDAHGATLAAVYEDLGVSGGTPVDRRPGLLAALDALQEHGAGVLLAAKRDRLARDTVVAAVIERVADENGAAVRTADGVGSGDTPEDQLLRSLVDAFASYERALIRARTKAALAVKKAKGQRTGELPYGYTVADDGMTLVECPVEQRTIRRLKRLRRTRTLRELVDYCDRNDIQARKSSWSTVTLSRLFRRESKREHA